MTRRHAEVLSGAIMGAVVGAAYVIGKSWWAGMGWNVPAPDALQAALVGAVAGALAFLVRGRAW